MQIGSIFIKEKEIVQTNIRPISTHVHLGIFRKCNNGNELTEQETWTEVATSSFALAPDLGLGRSCTLFIFEKKKIIDSEEQWE